MTQRAGGMESLHNPAEGGRMGDQIIFDGPVTIRRMNVYMEGGPMEGNGRGNAGTEGKEIDVDRLIRCAESLEALGDIIAEIGDNPRGEAMQIHAERIGWMIVEQARPLSAFLRENYAAIRAALGSQADSGK